VIAAQSEDIRRAGWGAVCFPIGFSAIGILVCLIASYLAALISPVKSENMITRALRSQLIVSTFLMIPTTYFLATYMLPDQLVVKGVDTLHATSLNGRYSSFFNSIMC
jgi:Na+/H+-translocating membrane pyrophosphatase